MTFLFKEQPERDLSGIGGIGVESKRNNASINAKTINQQTRNSEGEQQGRKSIKFVLQLDKIEKLDRERGYAIINATVHHPYLAHELEQRSKRKCNSGRQHTTYTQKAK